MVVKSTVNFEQYKQEVRQYYMEKYPKKPEKVDEFIEYLSSTYADIGRTFFSYKLAWFLFHRKKQIVKNQHFWVAFIGKKGGEGKSTLAKQTLHFLDPSFNGKRIACNYEKFITEVYNAKRVDKVQYPSVLMDEVEISTHSLSKKGRKLRDIITKIRQLNLFVGICANSLSDIPPFIYERLTVVIYLDDKHRYWLWDNIKDKPKHAIIEDIKALWKEKRHATFIERTIRSRAYLKNQGFSKESPFDDENYLKNKEDDLYKDINDFIKVDEPEEQIEKKEPVITNEMIIREIKRRNPTLPIVRLAETLCLSRKWTGILWDNGGKRNNGDEYTNYMPGGVGER